jgi:hypothetical protein
MLVQLLEGGLTVVGQVRLVSLEPQGSVERLADGRFVVNHEHSHANQCGGKS